MPGFDKTGPMGKGSNTGGGFGQCNNTVQGDETVPDTDCGVGRGGLRRGGGTGRCSGGSRGRGRRRGGNGAGGLKQNPIKDTDNSETRIESLERENEELGLRLAELESALKAETK
ncbi:MAG: DUF5320 domain-containing protein [Proteobacteria bacterium]|nr:DUF5320 domain-containing protein [Pseudomonadota bacterium]